MTVDNFVTLGFLVLLQCVLGLDNLLYISIESKRAPEADRKRVRRIGIGIAIGLRIALLFALINLIKYVQVDIIAFEGSVASGHFNLHSLIVLAGGAFIVYTAVKEVWHMMNFEPEDASSSGSKTATAAMVSIVIMNLVFSFDSILSAMALSKVFWVMATAIVIGGIIMMVLADRVSEFLARNRMYEVLGMFILLIVGIMLLSEGGHLAKLHLFGNPVEQMSKTTFYFVISVLVVVDIVQSRFQRRLLAARQSSS